jgi:hypothetical protein
VDWHKYEEEGGLSEGTVELFTRKVGRERNT